MLINKEWLGDIAKQIEADYGMEKKNEVIGNIETIGDNETEVRAWFEAFLQRLSDKEIEDYARKLLESHCPCRCELIEQNIRKNYEISATLIEFADNLRKDGLFDDDITIKEGSLIATKRFAYECGIKHQHADTHYAKCHCTLGSIVKKPVPDVFCHCCVGFYKKMFKEALGIDIKVEMLSSVITGGEACSTAIYFPDLFFSKCAD